MDELHVGDAKDFPPLSRQSNRKKAAKSPSSKQNKPPKGINQPSKQTPSLKDAPRLTANDVKPQTPSSQLLPSNWTAPETLDIECITPGSPLYKCHLCTKTFPAREAQQHMLTAVHKENRARLTESLYYLQLENPPEQAIEKLEEFLERNSESKMYPQSVYDAVDDFIGILNLSIQSVINPKASVRLFGSWLSGLAIKSFSDVNLDLLYGMKGVRLRQTSTSDGDDRIIDDSADENSTEDNPAQILSKIAQFLNTLKFKNCEEEITINSVKYEYEKSIPSVNFRLKSKDFNLKFEILLYGQRSYETSMLIKKYGQLDKRFLTLARCLRIWANACSLDDQESGTWPPHAFTIMLIHFLQKREPPVLPYLQESGRETSESLRDKLNDPDCQEMENIPDKSLEGIMATNWKSENTESIGVLWLEFFRYFSTQFRAGKEVLSIRKQNSPVPLTHKDKGWTSKIIAIEEPFRTWLNLSRTVGKREIYDVFMHIFRESFAYFVIPHDKKEPIYNQANFQLLRTPFKDFNETLGNMSLCDDQIDQLNDPSDNDTDSDGDDSDSESEKYKDSSARFREAKILSSKFGLVLAPNEQVASKTASISYSESRYSFSFSKFKWFRNPSKFCHVCRKSGHSGKQCPTANLPKLIDLPNEFPSDGLDFFSSVFDRIYERNKITTARADEHHAIAKYLEDMIKEHFETAVITLFGSSVNGFGSENCDVDLCMTFSDDPTGVEVNQKVIIEKLANILRKCPRIVEKSVTPIVHAKVPICKFQYKKEGRKNPIECDISLYNILALSNTSMLRTYTLIDERVAKLGTIVKHFAKVCDIGDASRGSLSSYAYTLMTLHYLQQIGVIPVLQELYVGEKPKILVDKWNTWFFGDLSRLDHVWPHRGENKASIAELFIGFLRYYAEEFQFQQYVVCCRRLKKLSRLEKMWTGKKISIEDPFLLKHNLGQGLDNRMATFIKSCVILGRNHFGRSLFNSQLRHGNIGLDQASAYLFNRKVITDGPLPSGRGCRICHKVAHKLRDCPLRRNKQQTRSPILCDYCSKPGHIMRQCPEIKPVITRPYARRGGGGGGGGGKFQFRGQPKKVVLGGQKPEPNIQSNSHPNPHPHPQHMGLAMGMGHMNMNMGMNMAMNMNMNMGMMGMSIQQNRHVQPKGREPKFDNLPQQ